MVLNFFVLIPLFNYIYWLLIWARRRTLTLFKKSSSEPLTQPLTAAPRPPTARRILFEYAFDYRDLALDGRHWRAQFGGSSSPNAPKMGAYICCGPRLYPFFRFVLAGFASALFAFRFIQFESQHDRSWTLMIYFDSWVLLISFIYFSLAFILTALATCTEGAESSGTPVVIWFVWAVYGALLPASILNCFLFALVANSYSVVGLISGQTGNQSNLSMAFDITGQCGTALIVLIDSWVNRQPYYATFHAFAGALCCWGYMLFNVVYVLTGGRNELDMPYIYRALNWRATNLQHFVTPGKITLLELFALLPLFNALYWCMLWARRRARVAAKQSAV